MNRIEKVREVVDEILLNMTDADVMQHVLYNPLFEFLNYLYGRNRKLTNSW